MMKQSAPIDQDQNAASMKFVGLNRDLEDLRDYQTDYNLETLTYLTHLLDPSRCLKYVFKSGLSESFRSQLRWLNVLANYFNCPALFISPAPAEMDSSHFICGVLYDNQLLFINPLGERLNRDLADSLLAISNTQRDDHIIKKLYISNDVIQQDTDVQSSCGPICIELLREMSQKIGLILSQFQVWGQLSKEKSKVHLGLSYQVVSIRGKFVSDQLEELTSKNVAEVMTRIRKKHDEELRSAPIAQMLKNDDSVITPDVAAINRYLDDEVMNAPEQVLIWKFAKDNLPMITFEEEDSLIILKQRLNPVNAERNTEVPENLVHNLSMQNDIQNRLSDPDLVENCWELDVPGDNSCLFWAAAIAYLLEGIDNDDFQGHYLRVFGKIENIDQVKRLLKNFNPFLDTSKLFDNPIMNDLIREDFRSRVIGHMADETNIEDFRGKYLGSERFEDYLSKMQLPSSWGGDLEIMAISRLLKVNIVLDGMGLPQHFPQEALDKHNPTIKITYTTLRDDQWNPSVKNHFHYKISKGRGDHYKKLAEEEVAQDQDRLKIIKKDDTFKQPVQQIVDEAKAKSQKLVIEIGEGRTLDDRLLETIKEIALSSMEFTQGEEEFFLNILKQPDLHILEDWPLIKFIRLAEKVNVKIILLGRPYLNPVSTEKSRQLLITTLKESYTKGERFKLRNVFQEKNASQDISKTFVNLAIVMKQKEGSKDEENKQSEFYHDSRMMNPHELVYGRKKECAIKSLFSPLEEGEGGHRNQIPNKILIEGWAGIGKTVLCQYLTMLWARGVQGKEERWWLDEKTVVIWIRLKNLANYDEQNCSLGEIVRRECFGVEDSRNEDYPSAIQIEADLAVLGENVVLLLDGFDEVAEWYHEVKDKKLQTLTTRSELLKFELLGARHKHRIILTTRPNRVNQLDNMFNRHLETIGFKDTNIEQYVLEYFKETPQRSELLLSSMRSNINLWGIAHIPVNLALICLVWKLSTEKIEIHELITMTELYTEVIKWLLRRDWTKHPIQLEDRVDTLKELVGEDESSEDSEESKTQQKAETLSLKYFEEVEVRYSKRLKLLEEIAWEAQISVQHTLSIPGESIIRYLKREHKKLENNNIMQKKFIKSIRKLGLLESQYNDRNRSVRENSYYFPHLTFQEYFAAKYWMRRYFSEKTEERKEAEQLLKKYKNNPRFFIFWQFATGLLKNTHQRIIFLQGLVSEEPFDYGWTYCYTLLIHCLNECDINNQDYDNVLKLLSSWIYSAVEAKNNGSLYIIATAINKFKKIMNSNIIIKTFLELLDSDPTKILLLLIALVHCENLPEIVVRKLVSLLTYDKYIEAEPTNQEVRRYISYILMLYPNLSLTYITELVDMYCTSSNNDLVSIIESILCNQEKLLHYDRIKISLYSKCMESTDEKMIMSILRIFSSHGENIDINKIGYKSDKIFQLMILHTPEKWDEFLSSDNNIIFINTLTALSSVVTIESPKIISRLINLLSNSSAVSKVESILKIQSKLSCFLDKFKEVLSTENNVLQRCSIVRVLGYHKYINNPEINSILFRMLKDGDELSDISRITLSAFSLDDKTIASLLDELKKFNSCSIDSLEDYVGRSNIVIHSTRILSQQRKMKEEYRAQYITILKELIRKIPEGDTRFEALIAYSIEGFGVHLALINDSDSEFNDNISFLANMLEWDSRWVRGHVGNALSAQNKRFPNLIGKKIWNYLSSTLDSKNEQIALDSKDNEGFCRNLLFYDTWVRQCLLRAVANVDTVLEKDEYQILDRILNSNVQGLKHVLINYFKKKSDNQFPICRIGKGILINCLKDQSKYVRCNAASILRKCNLLMDEIIDVFNIYNQGLDKSCSENIYEFVERDKIISRCMCILENPSVNEWMKGVACTALSNFNELPPDILIKIYKIIDDRKSKNKLLEYIIISIHGLTTLPKKLFEKLYNLLTDINKQATISNDEIIQKNEIQFVILQAFTKYEFDIEEYPHITELFCDNNINRRVKYALIKLLRYKTILSDRLLEELYRLLDDTDDWVREETIKALGSKNQLSGKIYEKLVELCGDTRSSIKEAAYNTLFQQGHLPITISKKFRFGHHESQWDVKDSAMHVLSNHSFAEIDECNDVVLYVLLMKARVNNMPLYVLSERNEVYLGETRIQLKNFSQSQLEKISFLLTNIKPVMCTPESSGLTENNTLLRLSQSRDRISFKEETSKFYTCHLETFEIQLQVQNLSKKKINVLITAGQSVELESLLSVRDTLGLFLSKQFRDDIIHISNSNGANLEVIADQGVIEKIHSKLSTWLEIDFPEYYLLLEYESVLTCVMC